uniref:HTH psq-type domain-containing protein n=1 Tax=Ditylenchus dipsaci TaxID=166011 RepID=A0A915DHM8_9BILA
MAPLYYGTLLTMALFSRKRTDFTLEQKRAIIEAAKRESNQTKLARDFTMKWGFEVKRTAVQSILSNKEAIEAAVEEGVPMALSYYGTFLRSRWVP